MNFNGDFVRRHKVKLLFAISLFAAALGAFLLRRSSVLPTDQIATASGAGRQESSTAAQVSTNDAEAIKAAAKGAVSAELPGQEISANPQDSPEPELPVIDFDACGSPNPKLDSGEPMPYKLQADDRLYSSWEENRTLLRELMSGTEVTRVGAVNITREPDRGVITAEVDEALRPLKRGDEVLGYGLHSDGFTSFWGKGISFTVWEENIAFKGTCGFTDKSQCQINITKPGIKEWWIQLKTGDGVTGWILGIQFNGDNSDWRPNAGLACRD